jgi:hypothetical protein
MVQPWAVERLTDDHVQQLQALRRRPAESSPERPYPVPASLTPATSGVRPPRSRHLPLGSHVGTWLIRAGTRLGGASVRTS